MARNKPYLLGANTTIANVGPLFVDNLAAQGVISTNQFSFSMGYKNDTFVDFGNP